MVKFRWETEFKETPIGKIPKDWKEVLIKEIGNVVTGKTPPTKRKEFWKNDYPFITPSDINGYDVRYGYNTERFVSKEWVKRNPQLLIPPNSICFVCIGSTIGKVCLTKEYSTTNQQINTVIPSDKFDPLFVFYLLRGHQFRIREEYGGGGVAKDIISKSKFENVSLPVPPTKEEQKRIATVLSWFDNLIENKRRQNEILEKTAMAIFKSWFIDFEPFQDEEFVYSEELDMEIPKGWEIKKFGEVVEFHDKKRVPLSEIERQRRKGPYPYYGASGIIDYIDDYIFDGFYLLVAEDGTVIDENGFVVSRLVHGKFWANNHVHVITGKGVPIEYLYLHLKFTPIEPYVTGAVQAKLNQKNFSQMPVLIPPKPILEKFHSLVEPLFRKIIINEKEIMVLKKARDTLLPQLVFGRLRVEEV